MDLDNATMKFKLIKISILLIIYTGLSDASAITGKKTPQSLPPFYISVESALHKIKQNAVLVDVRSHEKYQQVRIPESINIPLYAIKAKAFLKQKKIVLINEGFQRGLITEECKKLRDSGFHASILRGGLNAWKENNGKFMGNIFAVQAFNKVSPQDFYQERHSKAYLIIDVSKIQHPKSQQLIPKALHLPKPDEKSLYAVYHCGELKCRGKQKQNRFQSILFLNIDGKNYLHIETMVKKANIRNVFYLSGGLNAYHRFVQNLARSLMPRDSRIKTLNKCEECGKQQVP